MITKSMKMLPIASILFLVGCATTTNFTSIPISERDFEKPVEELRNEFSDVALFESHWRGFKPVFGNIEALEEKWGKANEVETRWGTRFASSLFGIGLVVYSTLTYPLFFAVEALAGPFPLESHHWFKGNTHVEVTVARRGFEGYEKKVTYWEWEKTKITSK